VGSRQGHCPRGRGSGDARCGPAEERAEGHGTGCHPAGSAGSRAPLPARWTVATSPLSCSVRPRAKVPRAMPGGHRFPHPQQHPPLPRTPRPTEGPPGAPSPIASRELTAGSSSPRGRGRGTEPLHRPSSARSGLGLPTDKAPGGLQEPQDSTGAGAVKPDAAPRGQRHPAPRDRAAPSSVGEPRPRLRASPAPPGPGSAHPPRGSWGLPGRGGGQAVPPTQRGRRGTEGAGGLVCLLGRPMSRV